MKQKVKKGIFPLVLVAALSFNACSNDGSSNDGSRNLQTIVMEQVVVDTTSITLAWDNPGSSDRDSVRVTWSKDGSFIGSLNVGEGFADCRIGGLAASSRYGFIVRAVDEYGNVSDNEHGFTVTTPGEGQKIYSFIYNAADLDAVHDSLGGNYILMADINLGVAPFNTGGGWVPLGGETRFTGIFNGNNHVIRNLTINADGSNGFFGVIENAHVCDLTLESVNVAGGYHTGALVCWSVSSTYINCHVTGTVSGRGMTGGLIGRNDSSVVRNCHADVLINEGGSGMTGGLTGYNAGSLLTDCYATGDVNGGDYSGGLVGLNASSTLANCYASGHVSGNREDFLGGLVGYDNDPTEEYSYNSCYYDSETSGLTDTGKGEPRTTAQLKSIATYSGWDFSGITTDGTADTWSIDNTGNVNKGYPYLSSCER